MTDPAVTAGRRSGPRAWLTTDTPASRLHAGCVQGYLGWLRLAGNPLAMLGLGIVVALILAAIFAPLLAPTDPLLQDLGGRLLPPLSPGYILGSDELGRDILSRLLYGARITLYIVALVVVTAPIFGLIVGTLAGYAGGWVDVVKHIGPPKTDAGERSEEHTSELQSLMRI